jgi:hypothetical protein
VLAVVRGVPGSDGAGLPAQPPAGHMGCPIAPTAAPAPAGLNAGATPLHPYEHCVQPGPFVAVAVVA